MLHQRGASARREESPTVLWYIRRTQEGNARHQADCYECLATAIAPPYFNRYDYQYFIALTRIIIYPSRTLSQ